MKNTPQNYVEWERQMPWSMTVIEAEGQRFSGLLDAAGNKLMVKREQIGFVRFPEASRQA